VFQLTVVKVTLFGETLPSVGSLLESGIVTVAVGCLFSTMVNVAVPPASVVVKPEVGVTVTPAASLSVFETATSAALAPLYAASALVAVPVTTV
jgi:hypothetical protein